MHFFSSGDEKLTSLDPPKAPYSVTDIVLQNLTFDT